MVKKNNVYSCTPQFYDVKVEFKGVYITPAIYPGIIKLSIVISQTVCFIMKFAWNNYLIKKYIEKNCKNSLSY